MTHCSVLYMLYLSSHLVGLSVSVPSPEKLSPSTLPRHIPSPLVLWYNTLFFAFTVLITSCDYDLFSCLASVVTLDWTW